MTNEEAQIMLEAKLKCLTRETSGTDIDCNHRNCDECSLCYEQGNMGEQKEALNLAIQALEQISHLTDRPCSVCEFHKMVVVNGIVCLKQKGVLRDDE